MDTSPRPKTVVICGSTRYRDAIVAAGRAEAMAGHIVLGPWSFERDLTPETAQLLMTVHRHMIHMADEVLVVNPDGYLGDSTRSEVAYAGRLGKPVRWLAPPIHEQVPQPARPVAVR